MSRGLIRLDGVKAAGNSPVAANLISTLSYQFAKQYDPRTAVPLVRIVLRGAENSATPASLALLYERIAWAHAKGGDRPAAERGPLGPVPDLTSARLL